jgi:hypothetical protein
VIEKNSCLSPLDARAAHPDTNLRRAASCSRMSREPGAAHVVIEASCLRNPDVFSRF